MTGIELSDDGFVVDAALLAEAFGLPPADVPSLMRNGAITSRCETGIDKDEGNWRLTFYHAGRAYRMTVDKTGAVIRRATFDTPSRPPGSGATSTGESAEKDNPTAAAKAK